MSLVTVKMKTSKLTRLPIETFCLLTEGLACALFLVFGLFRALLTIRTNLIPKNLPRVKKLQQREKRHICIFQQL